MIDYNNCAIGIDPGKTGGISLILRTQKGFRLVACQKMPIDAFDCIDVKALYLLFTSRFSDCKNVFIEKAFAGVGQAGTRVTSFTIGLNYGRIVAALELARVAYQEVLPRSWQSQVLKGAVGEDSKEKAAAVFNRLCDSGSRALALTPRSRKPHEGVVDASLLGYWGITETTKIKKV